MRNLRAWLRRLPHPVKVMLDNDPKRTIEVPTGRSKWVEIVGTLEALEYETIACIGPSGETLRASRYEPTGDAASTEPEEETIDVDERSYPIVALTSCIEKLVETVRQCAQEASQRANVAEQAYSQAVMARAQAEAAAVVAQQSQPQGDGGMETLARAVMQGAAAARATPNGAGGGHA